MGIHDYDIAWIDSHLPDWKEDIVAVLGSQQIREERLSFRAFAAREGIIYQGFDWNGADGCLQVDLCRPIDPGYTGYDLILNFGTTEHCYDQEAVFRNLHDMCKPGGAFVHAVPLEGHWKNHCPFTYPDLFFSDLSAMNGYRILTLARFPHAPLKDLNRAILLRTDAPFKGIPPVRETGSRLDTAPPK